MRQRLAQPGRHLRIRRHVENERVVVERRARVLRKPSPRGQVVDHVTW